MYGQLGLHHHFPHSFSGVCLLGFFSSFLISRRSKTVRMVSCLMKYSLRFRNGQIWERCSQVCMHGWRALDKKISSSFLCLIITLFWIRVFISECSHPRSPLMNSSRVSYIDPSLPPILGFNILIIDFCYMMKKW